MRILARQDTEVQINADAHPSAMEKDSVIIYFDNRAIKITHVELGKLMIQEVGQNMGICIQTLGAGGILLTTRGG